MADEANLTIPANAPLGPAELAKLLQEITASFAPNRDTSLYRYVIYARKSTDEESKQIRSLPDQVLECREHAVKNGLNYDADNIIEEAKSAKEAGIRPKFRDMLLDIQKGKYDGIIAWHPDRLCRNMMEAGQLIDLIDKDIIKDIKFVSFPFSNDSAGKMLLGISFVLSKQYVDKLSDDVSRGIKHSIEAAAYINKRKHGYYKDINQYLRPDSLDGCDNYNLISTAWQMRLNNKTLEEIAEHLNANHYSATVPKDTTGKKHQEFFMRPKHLSYIFRDPVYAGVLQYGGDKSPNIKNLIEVYPFEPMISVDEFLKINKISRIEAAFKQKIRGRRPGTRKAELLYQMLLCGACGEEMVAYIRAKKTKLGKVTNYYYLRCDNEECPAYGPSIRAHVALDFIYQFLEDHKKLNREAYDQYVMEMKRVVKERTTELERQRKTLTLNQSDLEKKITEYGDFLAAMKDDDAVVKQTFVDRIKIQTANLEKVKHGLEEVKTSIANQNAAVLSYAQFLELFAKLPAILRQTRSLKAKDDIIREIYLNLTIKDGKVTSHQLKPPFDRFLNGSNFPSGGPKRT